eukprot:6188758-Pleurochrysis_carterae.AAC.1
MDEKGEEAEQAHHTSTQTSDVGSTSTILRQWRPPPTTAHAASVTALIVLPESISLQCSLETEFVRQSNKLMRVMRLSGSWCANFKILKG